MKVTDVIDLSSSDKNFLYGNQAHFDFVLYNGDRKKKALMAVEINGNEHYNNKKVRVRDTKKKVICKENGLELIHIHNNL